MAGGRHPCPGTPTSAHGFANQDKWLICFGEVFRIYAKGKSIGQAIRDHDDIFLYYVNANKWVGLVGITLLITAPVWGQFALLLTPGMMSAGERCGSSRSIEL